MVAEGVGLDGGYHEPSVCPGRRPLPAHVKQGTDRGGVFAGLAERQEVMLPHEGTRRLIHRVRIKRPLVLSHVAPQRVPSLKAIIDPVPVRAGEGTKPRIEVLRYFFRRVHRYISRQDGGEPLNHRSPRSPVTPPRHGLPPFAGKVHVHHLSTRVNPGVGPASDRHSSILAHDLSDSALELTLHRTKRGLNTPPFKVGAVIGQIEPDAGHGG